MAALRPSRTLRRYVLLQTPGWLLVGTGLGYAASHDVIAPSLAAGLFALWLAKDAALYPFLRKAYEDGQPSASALLIGRIGQARERLAPRGYVRLGSELWRVELAPGCPPVETGGRVRVLEARGLTLIVEPE